LALAEDGADVVVFDVAEQLPTVRYAMSVPSDLDETARLVRETGRRCSIFRGDVRSDDDLSQGVDDAIGEYGGIDIVIANAGIFSFAENTWSLTDEVWRTMIDVNLTGVWRTCKAIIPHMIDRDRGGAIVLISSISGFKGIAGTAHYCSAKHGLSGLMRTLAVELAPHAIRVNAIHPSSVATPMVENDVMTEMLAAAERAGNDMSNLLDIALLPPSEISNAIRWIVSDDALYITGVNLPVDAGFMVK
jgi:SDR family mycofactocin-dependent oxidoreductase